MGAAFPEIFGVVTGKMQGASQVGVYGAGVGGGQGGIRTRWVMAGFGDLVQGSHLGGGDARETKVGGELLGGDEGGFFAVFIKEVVDGVDVKVPKAAQVRSYGTLRAGPVRVMTWLRSTLEEAAEGVVMKGT